jgi:hypothetical protein
LSSQFVENHEERKRGEGVAIVARKKWIRIFFKDSYLESG